MTGTIISYFHFFFSYILPAQEGSNLIYIPITACNFLSIFIVVTRDPASNMVKAVKGVEDSFVTLKDTVLTDGVRLIDLR